MGALVGVSLWIALVTVVPGLITIAVIYGAFVIAEVDSGTSSWLVLQVNNDWIAAAIAITIMVLTQALGILLEEVLVRLRLLGSESQKLLIPEGMSLEGEKEIEVQPYKEYAGLYMLLSQFGAEDTQGHLRRVIAQFFLTNNSLVSFSAGLVVSLFLAFSASSSAEMLYYCFGLFMCLLLSYWVAVIRFREMTKSLWAVRNIKGKVLQEQQANQSLLPTKD